MPELLQCLELNPPETARTSVVWLHGLGADGHDFEPIVPLLQLNPALATRFVFPHAPRRAVTINMGVRMRAWYDIREMSLKRDVDETGVRESDEQVRALIDREIQRGVPASKIVLAGFSQGGAVALHTGLRLPLRLAGLVALSSYLVCDNQLESERSDENRDVPIFQAHGNEDPMVLPEAGRLAYERLVGLGYAVEWKSYPMGHEICPDEMRDLGLVLNRFLET